MGDECMIKYVSTNVLKAFAIISVIILHSLQGNSNVENLARLQRAGLFNFWALAAVPIFIVITGFHYAKSINKYKNIMEWYNKKEFCGKFFRIFIPFMVAQIVFNSYYCLHNNVPFTMRMFVNILRGGSGPGGYYTSIIMQILVVFPIIYWIIKKSPIIGTLFLIQINIFYEYAVKSGIIGASFNRICFIRLMTGVVLGILLYLFFDKIKNTVIPTIAFSVGLLFLFWYTFGSYQPQIVGGWITNSFASSFYAAGIVYWFILGENAWIKVKEKGKITRMTVSAIELLGKASYHIFLVQQIWFSLNISYRNLLRVR